VVDTQKCSQCGTIIIIGENDYYDEENNLLCLDCLLDNDVEGDYE